MPGSVSLAALGSARLYATGRTLGPCVMVRAAPGRGQGGGLGKPPGGARAGCYVFPKLTPPGVRTPSVRWPARRSCSHVNPTMVVLGWWWGHAPRARGWWSPLPPTPQVCLSGMSLPRPTAGSNSLGAQETLPRPPPPRESLAPWTPGVSAPPVPPDHPSGAGPRPAGEPPSSLNPKCRAERRFPALPSHSPQGPLPTQRTEGEES